MANKVCGKCYKIKKIIGFSEDKSRKDSHCYCCKECLRRIGKLYYSKNKEKIQKQHKKYYQKNIQKIKKRRKEQRKINKKEINKYARERRKKNIKVKLLHNLRARLVNALKRNSKSKSTIKLVGCSIKYLKQHLEKQFKRGMTWKNYGKYGWHIDHKRPCVSFDLSKQNEQRKCFSYSNLQPLWAKENLRKGKNNG